MLSSRWRGTTVTSSISATKATSAWVRPAGRGSAMAWSWQAAAARESADLSLHRDSVFPLSLSIYGDNRRSTSLSRCTG